jgi:hypothetical protein
MPLPLVEALGFRLQCARCHVLLGVVSAPRNPYEALDGWSEVITAIREHTCRGG